MFCFRFTYIEVSCWKIPLDVYCNLWRKASENLSRRNPYATRCYSYSRRWLANHFWANDCFCLTRHLLNSRKYALEPIFLRYHICKLTSFSLYNSPLFIIILFLHFVFFVFILKAICYLKGLVVKVLMKNLFSRTRIFLSHSFYTFQKYQPKKERDWWLNFRGGSTFHIRYNV